MNITITGSLGHIGRPLTETLIRSGHHVSVVSSSPERREDIEALGAVAAVGSVEDADFVMLAFAGADAVFTMVPPNFREMDQIAYYTRVAVNYARAVETSGVKRVVNLSSYGAHLDHGTGLILGAHHAEIILNALPDTISVTQLRPGYFYYNLYHFTAMLKGAGIIGANYGGPDKILLVAPSDIAAAAAEELTAEAHGRSIRYVVSDEKTADEIAAAIGAVTGKPGLRWMTFTDEEAQQGAVRSGMPLPLAAMFTELGASLHNGKLAEDYELNKPARLGAIKLDDFMKEYTAAYNAADAPQSHGN